jgi:hypothetical protein
MTVQDHAVNASLQPMHERGMSPLVASIIEAHGGLERWRSFTSLSAHLIQGGALWGLKGAAGLLDDTCVTIDLTRQEASHAPFGDARRRTRFTPELVEILSTDGQVLERLPNPRASFEGHGLETPWSEPQLAYFAGVAMWTYLTIPFLLAHEGVRSEEIDPWIKDGEHWRRLRVEFAPGIATHSRIQTLYVDDQFLLKRHDYDVKIAGNTPGAHFISDYRMVQGVQFPTRRRIYPRQPDGTAVAEPLVVSIDIDSILLR